MLSYIFLILVSFLIGLFIHMFVLRSESHCECRQQESIWENLQDGFSDVESDSDEDVVNA